MQSSYGTVLYSEKRWNVSHISPRHFLFSHPQKKPGGSSLQIIPKIGWALSHPSEIMLLLWSIIRRLSVLRWLRLHEAQTHLDCELIFHSPFIPEEVEDVHKGMVLTPSLQGKDPFSPKSYRGIILTSVITKSRALLDGILPTLTSSLSSLRLHIPERCIQLCQESLIWLVNMKYSCFYNFASAFDTAECPVLLDHLYTVGELGTLSIAGTQTSHLCSIMSLFEETVQPLHLLQFTVMCVEAQFSPQSCSSLWCTLFSSHWSLS